MQGLSLEEDARGAPGPGRIRDLDALALKWYGQSLQRLVALAGLQAVDGGLPSDLPGASTGHVVATSHGFDASAGWVVVGGPCIGDSSSWPTLEALYDSVQVILLARALGAPALLFVGDREEALASGGQGRWAKTGERYEQWLPRLGEALSWTRLKVVRTASAAHEAALAAIGEPARRIDGTRLDAAFHLGSFAVRPQSDEARVVSRRVIEAHLPQVVARHLAWDAAVPLPRVLLAENLQQAGVHACLAELCGADQVAHVAHFPAPSLSGGQRMYRAEQWDKAPASSLVAIAAGRADGLHPATRGFFEAWLDARTRQALAEVAAEY